MKSIVRNTKGFTLIELMIVIAIIGILAAIAIPQFAAYRMRSYNASALSDVRNANTTQAAQFADWQRYGATSEGSDMNMPSSFTYTESSVQGGNTKIDLLITVDVNGTERGIQIPVGNGVELTSAPDEPPAADLTGANSAFNAQSKHIQGDTCFAVDSDSTSVFQKQDRSYVGEVQSSVCPLVAAVPEEVEYSGDWVAK